MKPSSLFPPSPHRAVRRVATRLRDGEQGFAVAAAMFLGMALVIVMAVVVMRGMSQSNLTVNNVDWENAIEVAEAGIDVGLAELNTNTSFATVPIGTDLTDREAVIAAARAAIASDPTIAVQVGGGQAVIVKEPGSVLVYGVGFVPSASDPEAVARVVMAEYGPPLWKPETAVLVGGNIKVRAKKGDKDIEVVGGFHIEGNVELNDKSEENVNGCLTALSLTDKKPKPGQPADIAPYVHPDCPAGTTVGSIDIPEIDPLLLHKYSMYDICWDKTGAYYGPNWQQTDASADNYLAPPSIPGTEGDPCSGSLVIEDLGIAKGLDKTDEVIEFKDKKNALEGPREAVYYLEGRSAKLKVEDNQTLNLTLITSHVGNNLTCLAPDAFSPKIKKEQLGDIEIEVNKNASWYPHPAGRDYAVVSGGDLKVKIKGGAKKEDQGTMFGLVAAHEQIKIEANDSTTGELDQPKGGILGALIAEQACDTKDSKINDGKSEFKRGDFTLDPDMYFSDFHVKNTTDLTGLRWSTEL